MKKTIFIFFIFSCIASISKAGDLPQVSINDSTILAGEMLQLSVTLANSDVSEIAAIGADIIYNENVFLGGASFCG